MSENNKKSKSKMIIVLVVVLIAAGAGAYFWYNNSLKNSSQKTEIKYVEKELVEKPMAFPEEFIVNLSDEGGKSFISTKLTLAYPQDNKELEKEITTKMDKLEDIVNTTLRSKKAADFDGNGLENVKKELLEKINATLTTGKVTNIYVSKIVIQR